MKLFKRSFKTLLYKQHQWLNEQLSIHIRQTIREYCNCKI